ncbi:NADH dehydrogenase [ubiquinone] 1 alpha subcomplex subunit 4-like 2 isoform X2 [Garra rufa]|uniref:NADH dehydrogenase [ubiquinone] 1 alpha subcomplex subunit 4-like 2 isoform X2 n=1 Tax=Garra rufa TaxID=137080 RepID=UPI003CCE85FB
MLRKVRDQVKKHPGLIPQFFFICLGMGGAFLYLFRLARGPHVTWNKSNNPEPWNKLSPSYQYKEFDNNSGKLESFHNHGE